MDVMMRVAYHPRCSPWIARAILAIGFVFLFLAAPGQTRSTPQIASAATAVTARVETPPMGHPKDSADDPAIWIHPTDPALSTIIGTDKLGALEVYDLAGNRLQSIPKAMNNVDVRYNFPLGGERIDLVAAYNKTDKGLAAYRVNPQTRLLEDVVAPNIKVRGGGTALYHSPVSGKYYYFSNVANILRQYELFDNGSGKVTAKLVRTVTFGSFVDKTESVVADDVLGQLYVSEEAVAIWKLSAEPDGGAAKTMIDQSIANGGHLQLDVEGLAIYYKSDGTGYLIASSQGNNSFVVYTRQGNNAYIDTFQVDDGTVDKINATDGLDVTNVPLGSTFPMGVFVAQDAKNMNAGIRVNQNFKLVSWDDIANALGLTSDTSWNPRAVGQ